MPPPRYIRGRPARGNREVGTRGTLIAPHAVSATRLRDSPCLSVTIAPREDAMLRKFLADQRGATAIEYCLLAMFLSITIIAGARAIGTNMSNSMYGPIATNLN